MDYEKKQRLIALCNRMTEYGYTDGVEELESIFPQLAESEEENRKNNHGYYKDGKFWKASTLWEAVKGKIPQRVENRYVLQNCSWNIGTLREFAEEMRDVQEVSLDYPIILDMNGNILDGAHRVVKAYLEGKDIDIVYLGDDEWPEPDYDEEKAVKESKDKKIRGCIGIILTDATEQRFTDFGVSLKDCLAWLEKQKEQKSEKLDGKALLHTADKSYEIGYRDGKMDAQKEMEIDVKDYRLRDTWEYIDEFIKKFGRVPKDIDELSACVDYVIKHKSIDEKEQKPVKYISDSAWQKVKRAITDCKKLSEHYEDTKENFHQYYGGKAEGLQLALDYFGNENELPGQKPAEYSNEEEYLDSELRAFLRNYDKEYDDDPAVSDVAKHFYEIGKRRLRQEWSDETKQECGSIDVSGSIKTSRIKTLENLLSYLKYERKTTQEEINTSFIPCLENLLKDTENMNDHVEWNNATINGEPIPTENQSVDISLANWSEEDKEALDMCYELLLKAEYTLIDKGYFGSVQFIKDWLKSLPERFVLQSKHEWGEEDTKVLNDIVVFVSGYADKRVVSRWVEFLKSLRPKKNISYGELPLVSIDYMEGLDTDFEKQVGAVIASAMNREHQFTSKYIKWTAQQLMEYTKGKQNSEEEYVSYNKEWSEEEAKKAAEDYADEHPGMTHESDGSTIEDYDKPYNDFLSGVLWAKHQCQPKQELSIEKAIQWFKDTFFFQNNSSGRGEDYEISTYDFDSMEEMYESFRKSVIVESQPHWKPTKAQLNALSDVIDPCDDVDKYPLETLYFDLKKL